MLGDLIYLYHLQTQTADDGGVRVLFDGHLRFLSFKSQGAVWDPQLEEAAGTGDSLEPSGPSRD